MLLLVAMLMQPTIWPGWWIVSGDNVAVTYINQDTVDGPHDARNFLARTVWRSTQQGVKYQEWIATINCSTRQIRRVSLVGYSVNGKRIASQAVSSAWQTIVPLTGGDAARLFVCASSGKDAGYPSILSPMVSSDQFFRLLGLGVDREAAAALAAIDPKRSPKIFSDLLNAFIATDRQDLIKVVKGVDE